MLQNLWNYIKQNKKVYGVIVITLLLDYGLAILPMKIVQWIIDQMTDGSLTQVSLWTLLVILLVTTAISYVAIYIWILQLFKQSSLYNRSLSQQMFRKMATMRVPFYEKFRSGDIVTRFTNDIENIAEMLGFGAMCALIAISTIIITLPAMLTISWQITLLSLIPMVLMGVMMSLLDGKKEQVVEETRDAVAALNNEVLEVVEGIRVTRAYGRKDLGAKRFREKTAQLVKKANAIMAYQASYGRIANIFLGLTVAIVVGVGALYMKEGQITLGEIVALQLYALLLMEPMWLLTDLSLLYQSAKVSFKKVDELLETGDDMEVDGSQVLTDLATITFKDYSFQYANAQQASLNMINLRLEAGKTLGVVGKTGSGKTTLVRQLLRQYPAGSGQFLINDVPVTDYQRATIEACIGYVPQEHILFSKSVLENIRVGNDQADMIEIATAIAQASFTEDLERMSEGMDTMIGEKGVSISGGQKQRIAIARALLKQPDLLILDDSLSAVDAKTERHIIETIQDIRQGKMNVIVTHRLSAVSHADWVVVLDDGNISEEGTPEQLLAKKGWYYEQYERQKLEGEA